MTADPTIGHNGGPPFGGLRGLDRVQAAVADALSLAGETAEAELADEIAAQKAVDALGALRAAAQLAERGKKEDLAPHSAAVDTITRAWSHATDGLSGAADRLKERLLAYVQKSGVDSVASYSGLSRAVSRRARVRCEIEPGRFALAAAHLRGDPDLIEAICKIAARRLRAGEPPVPGIRYIEEESVQ